MAGYEDEGPFDEFAKSLTWEGWAERIRCPYLCLAGEADELSPLVYTERLLAALTVPRLLVVYQDARHSLGASPSTTLGPSPRTLMADWMVARLAGQAMESERWNVEASGRIARSPL